MRRFWALLSLTLPAAALSWLPQTIPGWSHVTVETANGPVVGHAAVNRSQVLEYLGIPYAQPPVGSLRFAAPAQYASKSRFIASNYSAICPETPSRPVAYPDATPQEQRIVAAFGSQLSRPQSEDCLTLNIWTKPTAKAKKGAKPVLVFFYGGRWSIGGTDTPFYNGQYLADAEDVVVVTVNFRINIFGWPGAPGVPKNIGLLDQRLAVEWVRDNIKGFGGDASKIVIFGQSSGSVAVDYWSYAYADDPIVSGYISHSGNVFSFPTNTEALAEQHWYNASAMLGCGSSGDVLPCMRSKNFSDIKAAAAKVKPPVATSQARSQPAFQPTIDNVNVFSVDEYASRSLAGNFSSLPYMFGNNDNEAGYYKIAAYAQGVVLPDAAWDAFNLQDFTCPNTFEAVNRANANVPTWLFRYFGDWDNLRLYPTSGAYHGSDLEMVFGASQDTEDELDRYLADGIVRGLRDPLEWWRVHYSDYPALSELAFDLLAISACSTECERVFSVAGNAISEERPRIKGDLAEAEQCLKSWLRQQLVTLALRSIINFSGGGGGGGDGDSDILLRVLLPAKILLRILLTRPQTHTN
ncbi:hypothetical protein B0A49_09466 [Cryomyces minteri]|uniref:Carboxylic ester hydrolase n=1 Tax=Cryomyces minteri TaxID=331657 RepID=A0A4U0WFZ1_9PEZI|nr:hypothetical protein B0A49_09466 [Cryomyces minteri]